MENYENPQLTEGARTLARAKLKRNSPIKINKDFKMPKIRIQEKNNFKEFVCACCGKAYTKQMNNFLKASSSILWAGNNGFLPICKNCTETIYEALVDFYSGNEEHALHHWCGIFDYPYDVWASAMATVAMQPGRSKISLYCSRINTKQVRDKGTTYFDTVRNEAGESLKIKTVEDIDTSAVKSENQFTVTKEMVKKWGYGHKAEEYEWLEEQEADWRSRVECKTKPQEELIRTICIAQLNIQKTQQSGGKVSEAMKTFQDLLGSCNLQPRQNAGDELTDQNTFGTLIKKYEEETPLPEPDPEWEDVDGIKDYFDTFFLGHLCNLVHIENDCTEKYNKIMGEYTVTPPVYENDEETVDVSLLDKFSSKGKTNEPSD